MNRSYKSCVLLVLAMKALPAFCAVDGLDVKLLLSVTDEQNQPVQNAQVTACFSRLNDRNDPWKGQTSDKVTIVTDKEGKGVAVRRSLSEMTVVVRKIGFYESRETLYSYTSNSKKLQWVPYEREVNLVLRKIENPIPMFAWGLHLMDYPVGTNEWVGFDMLRAEWMPPYGKGETEDVRFYAEQTMGVKDIEKQPINALTVRFMGAKNGVCAIDERSVIGQSWLKLPYRAPREGYSVNEFRVATFLTREGEGRYEMNMGTTNCFFRIRAKLDQDGNFLEGLYGKIKGPAHVEGGKRVSIDMLYYVNPTPNDLNMEFDPKQNLIRKKGVTVSVPLP